MALSLQACAKDIWLMHRKNEVKVKFNFSEKDSKIWRNLPQGFDVADVA